MKFVSIEEFALNELIENRLFQTVEHDLAKAFIGLMNGSIRSATLPQGLISFQLEEGLIIASTRANRESRFLVIDLEQSRLFDGLSDSDAIFAVQKSMRFAKKLWHGMSTNFSEFIVPQSTKAVLFPFSSYRPKPFRILFERSPLAERVRKRDLQGKFTLIWKATEGSGTKSEAPNETNFRKFFEQINEIYEQIRSLSSPVENALSGSRVLSSSNLDDLGGVSTISIFQPYDDWLDLLTSKQRAFIEEPLSGARRIEGAAGTGKTLCLMLKAVRELRSSAADGRTFHAVFITHSEATKSAILEFMSVIDPDKFYKRDRSLEPVTLSVVTLSELCASKLTQQIGDSEFVDRDALESKETQLLYISEALEAAEATDFASHDRFLSSEFKGFLSRTDRWTLIEMLQHEISVSIKGRAGEKFDVYKKCDALKYGIPLVSDADKGYIFTIFRRYQEYLGSASQFDTDDVVLTTIGQLDTPIWRRRRLRDGYDAILIDETHLFNINELHVFHHFTKSETHQNILFSIDRTQAVGDRGWTSDDIEGAVIGGDDRAEASQLSTVFRCSPQIVDLAACVVSSGALLFTNFANPLINSVSGFTEKEERIAKVPLYTSFPNDEAMIEGAFAKADQLRVELNCKRGDILIASLDRELSFLLSQYASQKNKPHIFLKKRGDQEAVDGAQGSGQYVIGHADFVGGLEFMAVVIVGADSGRIPPSKGAVAESSQNYLSYTSHNRLYVTITRARLRVEILGDQSRGPSSLLGTAFDSKCLIAEGVA
ncbi:UvrD-helicase domain-containing protein [Falsigemmobacter faecalis]|uniref:DNA 3'-5' helicase II n=1 Tax=Falsigemmobacter faecalis TaxID=2488730 RepID=A0A3P3D377_9RHOB|nr:UvrD-helicase domain-containing protein [Falsigemmobacter faecalis]RRH68869.1 hypothetical protein EG244_19070 [Falsigemmobacter faecalis]